MGLTRRQHRQLLATRGFCTSPPTVLWYLKSSWPSCLLVIGVGGTASACFAWGGWPVASGFFGGMTVAVLLRDLRWFIRLVRGWPLTSRIIDWEKLDVLLHAAQPDAETASRSS